MDEMTRKQGSNTKCANCASDLYFDPVSQALKCPTCQSVFEFDKSSDIERHSWQTRKEEGNYQEWVQESKFIKCQSCGAEVILGELDITHDCPYCGSTYVLERKSLPGYKPDGVVPFLFNEDGASDRFKSSVKKHFFAPHSFKKKTPSTSVHGIYIPAFTFDGKSASSYNGVLVKEIRKKDKNGNIKVERKIMNISGRQDMIHTNYIEESSSKITASDLAALLPYDLSKTFRFDQNYLRGYKVEHYDSAIEIAYDQSHQKMAEAIKRKILSGYDYTYVERIDIKTDFFEEFFAYRLIPLYILDFMYKNKRYTILMNGQSGKVGKGIPISPVKVGFTIFFIILIVCGIIALTYLG